MRKITCFKYQKIVVLLGCVVLSSLLVLILMNYSAAASAQTAGERTAAIQSKNSPQETYVVEFFYNDEFSQTASIAADNFAKLLAKETGLDVQASINPCEADIVRNLGAQETDLATMSALAYVKGDEYYGIQAKLVNGRYGAFKLRGQINIQASGGYTDIWGLQGKRFIASDPGSMSSYMLPTVLISETTGMTMNVFFSEVQFVGGHTQVIKDIYNGLADCGGTYEDARAAVAGEYPDVNDVVHVLSYTEYVPNDAWVFRKGLNAVDVQKLSDGIIAVAGTPDGEKALKAILGSSWDSIDTIQDSDFNYLRDVVKTFGLQMNTCYDIYLPYVNQKNGN